MLQVNFVSAMVLIRVHLIIQSEEWRDLFYSACGYVTKEYAEKFAFICARAVTISDFMFLFYLLGYIVLT